ncbi:MAG: hypothetical protein ABJL87_12175 [Anderseniella sp.]
MGFLFDGFVSSGNPRGYKVHEVVYLRLLRLLHRVKPGFVPQVTVVNEDVLMHITRNGSPTIVVAVHSPVDAVLSRVFQERAIQQSVLAANPRTVAEKAGILGFQGEQNFIVKTENTLLQIRRDLRLDRTVHLCVDYTQESSDGTALFISSAVFRIAELMTLNIVFSDAQVTPDGYINVHMHTHTGTEADSPHVIATAFVHWLKTVRGHTRKWALVPYQQV